jgi:hypothetical protein
MKEAIDEFRVNMGRVRNLGAIYQTLRNQMTPIVDLSDILRAELVLAVSAFDHYIHALTRIGMIEVYRGHRPQTPAFLRFAVSLENILQGMADPQNINWLNHEIQTRHGWQSFQQPDKVADAIRHISQVRLWEEVASQLGRTAQDVKQQLNLIVDRRNKIAHEADRNPEYPVNRWPIDEEMVDTSIRFIEDIAETIFTII